MADTPALHRALAADILRRLAARGAEPGERLSRLALARELGVSRTPVEGAIGLLESLGAVRIEGRAVILADAALPPERLGPPRESTEAEATRLIVAIARDRRAGLLPDDVSERFLRGHYGAARAVVDKALQRLAAVGAMGRNRGHGWHFRPGYASAEERAASYRFRLMIEPAGLLEPRFALPAGWAEAMRARHLAFLDRPWAAEHAVAFFETNAAFHLGLAEASGNRFLAQAVDQQNSLRRFSNYAWQTGVERVRVSVEDHLAVLDAIAARDMPAAAAQMRRHLAGNARLDQPRLA